MGIIDYFIKRKTRKIIKRNYLFAVDFPTRHFFTREEAYLSGLKLKYQRGFLIRLESNYYRQPVIMGNEKGVKFNEQK